MKTSHSHEVFTQFLHIFYLKNMLKYLENKKNNHMYSLWESDGSKTILLYIWKVTIKTGHLIYIRDKETTAELTWHNLLTPSMVIIMERESDGYTQQGHQKYNTENMQGAFKDISTDSSIKKAWGINSQD